MTETAERISELRKKEGLTQEQLADVLFVSRSLVSMWESGARMPDYYNIEKIAKIFNINETDIVPEGEYAYTSMQENERINEEIRDFTCSEEGGETEEANKKVIADFLSRQSKKNEMLFMSRYFYGKTYKSIAEEFGMKESVIRGRLQRIRKALKKLLKEELQ